VFDYQDRMTRLRDRMASEGVEVALFSIGPDLPYLAGYEASPSERLTVLVVPSRSEPVLLVPRLEAPRVTQDLFETRAWEELEDPVAIAVSLVSSPSKVAVGDQMWAAFLTRFLRHWPDAKLVPASSLTSQMRVLKEPAEIELLRRAAQGVDRVMRRVSDELRFAGRTEVEVARDLAEMTVVEGHDEAAFTIVASGPNGASPHHHPSKRLIEPGDVVVCDFGGRLGGYFSDSTRTFVVGEATAHQAEVHAAVLEANRAGRKAVASGVACQEVDRASRTVIVEAGFGDCFVHRTGHGIGLEVHEEPYMVEGNETRLSPGMAFSVEPGVYLPDRFGVRIEDIVVCTEDGVMSLNEADRALVEVG